MKDPKQMKCPKCQKEITHLEHWQESLVWWEYDPRKDDYEFEEIGEVIGEQGYKCPECGEELGTDSRDVRVLLGVRRRYVHRPDVSEKCREAL